MVSMPMELADKRFSSKSKAKDFFRAIQNDAKSGNRLDQPIDDKEQIGVIEALLETSAEYKDKVGPGVRYFFVGLASKYQNADSLIRPRRDQVALFIMRTDGTVKDFSWPALINNYGRDASDIHRNRVKLAMRSAIQSLRDEFRQNAFQGDSGVVCPDTGTVMTDYHQADVIYRSPSWKEMTDEFANREGGWNTIKLAEPTEGPEYGRRMEDVAIEEKWIVFYKERSRPLLVARSVNATSRS